MGNPDKECKTTFGLSATIPAEIVTHLKFELYS
jgi:hypothetical protein